MIKRSHAAVILLLAMISVQSGASIAKPLFPVVGAAGFATLRVVFAALMMTAFWRPWKKKLTGRQWLAIAAYGASLGGMNLTFYLALERIPLGVAVALEFTGPLAVALFASRRLLDFIWVILALAGVLLIVPWAGPWHGLSLPGMACALVAGFFWAVYIVFGKKAGVFAATGDVSALGMMVAALVVLPFGVMQSGARLLNLEIMPAALVVALLSGAVPYTLEMVALKSLPAKTFGILMSMEPAVAALIGFFALREYLSITQWMAIGCVSAASAGCFASAEAGKGTTVIDSPG